MKRQKYKIKFKSFSRTYINNTFSGIPHCGKLLPLEAMAHINKILFITLSNMGDVILTLPVLDYLRQRFPASETTVMIGPRAKEILENNPHIQKLVIYDKHSRLREKIKLFFELKKEQFDVIIDFRNTLYGALLPARYKTSPFLMIPKNIAHMRERNLYCLKKALRREEDFTESVKKSFYVSKQDKEYISELFKTHGIAEKDTVIIISPATAGATRKWPSQKFIELCQAVNKSYKIIIIGAKAHQPIAKHICENCGSNVLDFTGLTSLAQLLALLERTDLVVTGDTGTLQIASYASTPIVGLFGPSNEHRFGPWSAVFRVLKKEIFCRPCSTAQCKFGTTECMKLIRVEEVKNAIEDIVEGRKKPVQAAPKFNFKRILIVRTDRMGDVLLSTPVIKALRDTYPFSYIAMMVSPYAKEIVDGNPYLDDAIIYDKDGKHRSWKKSLKFAFNLRKKKFDVCFVLHPTNRVHLVTFFAGIPRRIGYDRKLGFLLTDKIAHTKQLGEKHELEYNLDVIRYAVINPQDKTLFMPIKTESEKLIAAKFSQEGIAPSDRLLAIHPGASCPSKIWPQKRFAELADTLHEKYGCKVLIVAGPKDIKIAESTAAGMSCPVINLAGKTSLSQLASVLKRCNLFISNDSGPVHIASAVGTPVISIFGRNQSGLSPARWGPVGKKDRIVHKEVGCIECLAHNCLKEFACLNAVTVENIVDVVESMKIW